jgi:hypothetical protein
VRHGSRVKRRPPNCDSGHQACGLFKILIDNLRLVRNQAAADNNLGGHQFIISCAQFGRDSLFYMLFGSEGGAAVIGLIRRSPDLRWPKADVEGESV